MNRKNLKKLTYKTNHLLNFKTMKNTILITVLLLIANISFAQNNNNQSISQNSNLPYSNYSTYVPVETNLNSSQTYQNLQRAADAEREQRAKREQEERYRQQEYNNRRNQTPSYSNSTYTRSGNTVTRQYNDSNGNSSRTTYQRVGNTIYTDTYNY